jgi:hypothetical protein
VKRRLAVPACVALVIGAAAHAQDGDRADAADLRAQLAAARTQPGHAETADGLLQRLIEAAPDDPEAPTWMLDRAEIALRRADHHGAASSLMFGVPAPGQAAWVSRHAAGAAELCARARAAIDAAVARLEERLLSPDADPDHAGQLAAEIEPHLARLVEVEQAARLPELEFVAAALRALAEPVQESRERALRDTTARALRGADPNEGSMHGSPSPRVALLAAALLLRSNDATARDAAGRLLDRLGATRGGGEQRTHAPIDAVRLCMAFIVCGRDEEAARVAAPGRGEDWLVDLLFAEAGARATVRGVRAADGSAVPAGVRAAALLLGVAERYDGGSAALDTAAGPSPLRQLVYEKIAALVSPGVPLGSADPEIALARAWALRSAGGEADAPTAREPSAECLALLEAVASRPDAHAAVRAKALWLLAAERERAEGSRAAAARDALARIVTDLPRTRLARAAAERIVREFAPDLSGPTVEFESSRQAAAVTSALRLLTQDMAPRDSVLVALAVALAGHADARGREWTEAIGACERINAADVREFVARMLTERIEAVLLATPPGSERADALASAAQWLERRGEAWRSLELRLRRLELINETAMEVDARSELDALAGSAVDRAGTVERARLRAARGVALRRAGDDAAAMAEFRTVAAEYERDARATGERAAAREAFWRAWAEMLEIARGADGAASPERAEQARRQRQRLELLDPALGGEPWAGRIRAATGGAGK